MPKRVVYHVTPHPDGGWQVKKRKASEPESRHPTKVLAVARAKELAKACQPSQVIVHRQNGTIEDESTYGADPYPPAG